LQRPIRILITGAGAPGVRGTVYALRNNTEGRPLWLTGVDIRQDVVGRFLVDRFYSVPHPEDPAYVQTLADICQREAIEVVIPQTTREVSVLSDHIGSFAERGVRLMVSSRPAIEVANNKWRLLVELEKIGCPVPRYRLIRCEKELIAYAAELGYPQTSVVVKPPFSNGMRGVRVLKEHSWDVRRFLTEKPSGLEIRLADLLEILRDGSEWPELLMTEYLPGPEYTVDVFSGSHMQCAVPRLRRVIRSGITFEAAMEFRSDLIRYSLDAARHIGLRYAVGFQFKLDSDGIPKVLESNPRVQGTMVASLFSGANVIWLAVKDLMGETPTEEPRQLHEALFYRFWGGIGVSNGDAREI
jgi:carbamoyl-phosphate synthase large subunit